jgi:hypothetical protein
MLCEGVHASLHTLSIPYPRLVSMTSFARPGLAQVVHAARWSSLIQSYLERRSDLQPDLQL